ncbi:MAG TPA: nuclear transport factor 2 family protein [Friedmanniella sp.]
MSDPRQLSETYFRAWKEHDWDALRAVLAPGVTFRGPLGSADGRDECLTGLQGMATMMSDVVVLQRFVEGADSLTWFELHTADAPPLPTASWQHTEDGLIVAIQATFDPRPLFAGKSDATGGTAP